MRGRTTTTEEAKQNRKREKRKSERGRKKECNQKNEPPHCSPNARCIDSNNEPRGAPVRGLPCVHSMRVLFYLFSISSDFKLLFLFWLCIHIISSILVLLHCVVYNI